MTPADAAAIARRRGHKLRKWQMNPYHPRLFFTWCPPCGATLLENGDGTYGGGTLRRDCASIQRSKANKKAKG